MIEHKKISLANYTSSQVGGEVEKLIVTNSQPETLEVLAALATVSKPWFILGGGTNLLVKDTGFAGIAIKLDYPEFTIHSKPTLSMVQVAAGVNWDQLVARTISLNLQGLECLSGIPGTVGGAVVQNIGAYGQEIQDSLFSIEVWDTQTQQIATFTKTELNYSYRNSLLKNNPRYVVLSASFSLNNSATLAQVKYPELNKQLTLPAKLTVVREKVLALRKSKGMLLDLADFDTHSTGSFFINPIVDSAVATSLQKQYSQIPVFPVPQTNSQKLSAAWLVEQAGFHKGFKLSATSPIQISSKHTLAICNYGGGTFAQIMELATAIQQRVQEKFGITLELEPVVIG